MAVVCQPQYHWPCAVAVWVAWCESRFQADAYSAAGPYRGLFQVWDAHAAEPARLYDPAYNISLAYELWSRRGWQPWPYCGRIQPATP